MNKKHVWDKKQAKSAMIPNIGKKYVNEPQLLKMLGNKIAGKRMIELGSGNGYWLRLLTKRGMICTGIEISGKQLALTKENSEGISYIKGDITALKKLDIKKESFDTALLEHVLLEIPHKKKIDLIMVGLFELLKKSGELIISELHPFAASLKPENIKTRSSYNYFSSGEIIKVVSKRIDGGETVYNDYHWTLSDIVSSLTRAGFKIVEIAEPQPSKKLIKQHPELSYRYEIPMSLWIKAVKP